MFDIRDYQRTHVTAVDLVANVIFYYRKLKMPLKSITLKPRHYNQFKEWVIKNIGEEQFYERGALMQMDGVNIELGSNLQLKQVVVDFWPATLEIAN